jgi:hypothetical protein
MTRTHTAARRIPEDPNTCAKRFLLDNDGNNMFGRLSDKIELDLADAIDECPPNVTTYLICAGAGTYYYPTEVGSVDPHATRLIKAHQKGLDPFGRFLSLLRQDGKETFVTCRMNDVHNPTADDEWNMPVVRKEHPDCIVDAEAAADGRGGWMSYCMDYSRKEVQEYMLSIIDELVSRYPMDGLQLDWMRFPRHLSGTPEQVWEKREHLTEFTSKVRERTNRAGVKLCVRLPSTVDGCRHLGLDVGQWAVQELIDMVVMSPFLTTDFVMPVDAMKEALGGSSSIAVYAAFDFQQGGRNHCPESLRATCSSLYHCGADGICVFNFPCWEEYLGARPYHWLLGLESTSTASAKPLLFSISTGHHRIENVDMPGILPVSVAGQTSLSIRLPDGALPASRARLLLQCSKEIDLSINGHECEEMVDFNRDALFAEHVDPTPREEGATDEPKPRIFRITPPTLRSGDNVLDLRNGSGADIEVTRVNLALW